MPGAPLLRAIGNSADHPITGGTISIHLDSRLGDDALVCGPGEADWMVGGMWDETCGVGTSAADGQRSGNRIALFLGDRVAVRPGEGWEAATRPRPRSWATAPAS